MAANKRPLLKSRLKLGHSEQAAYHVQTYTATDGGEGHCLDGPWA